MKKTLIILLSLCGVAQAQIVGGYQAHNSNTSFTVGAIRTPSINLGGLGLTTFTNTKSTYFGGFPTSLTTGSINTIFGWDCGTALTSGYGNIFFGETVGRLATTASNNVLIGTHAAVVTTTNTNNVIIGPGAGNQLNSNNNVGVGLHTLYYCTGDNNTAIGQSAMYNTSLTPVTGLYNIAVGSGAMPQLTSGGSNIGIGGAIFPALTTGSNNIGIGQGVGSSLTTGSNNILIGNYNTTPAAGSNNKLMIGSKFISNMSTGDVTLGSTEGSGGVQGTLYTSGLSAATYTISGAGTLTGNVTMGNSLNLTKHLIGHGSSPTGTVGSAAGTSATSTISAASDLAGQIAVTTGTASMGTAGTLITITFNSAYAVAPDIIITPANAATAALSGTNQVYVDQATASSTQFIIKTGSVALSPSTAYRWYFHIIE